MYRFDGTIKYYCREHYQGLVEKMNERQSLQLKSHHELTALLNSIKSLPLTLRAVAIMSTQDKLDIFAAEQQAAQTGEDETRIYARLHSVSNQLMIQSIKRWMLGDELADEN